MQHLFKTTIDFNFLIKHNLIPNEYIYLYLKHHKLNKTISDLKVLPVSQYNLDCFYEKLEEKGYIDWIEDEPTLRPKAIALFEESDCDIKWLELFSSYPIKIPDGHGSYRILRTKDHESKVALELKRMYVHLIKNKVGLHDKIMKGLKSYLDSNKHKMMYLVSLDKFIKDNMWEMYEDVEDKEYREERL